MLSAASLWWLATLALRSAGITGPGFSLAPGPAHALLMSGSFMPMYFAGFLCTAGPRWLALPAIDARSLLPLVVAWLGGWTLFAFGAHLDLRVAAAALAIVALAWSGFALRLTRMLAASAVDDRTHLRVIVGACCIGAAAWWLAAASLALGEPRWLYPLGSLLLWWFLAPVFAAAVHRMVPFFGIATPTLDARVDNALLWIGLAAMALQPLVDVALHANGGAIARIALLGVMLFDALAALFVVRLALRWRATQNLGIRLLAMLFVGFAWLGAAFALQAADAAAWALGRPLPGLRLGAVHALSMGFFASTMLAMVSRITCGQAGRLLHDERVVWWLFLVLQAATVLRIASALLPEPTSLLLVAALLWTAAMLAWSLRYVGWYGRPRFDGRPG